MPRTLHPLLGLISYEMKNEIPRLHGPGIGIETALRPNLAMGSPRLGDLHLCTRRIAGAAIDGIDVTPFTGPVLLRAGG